MNQQEFPLRRLAPKIFSWGRSDKVAPLSAYPYHGRFPFTQSRGNRSGLMSGMCSGRASPEKNRLCRIFEKRPLHSDPPYVGVYKGQSLSPLVPDQIESRRRKATSHRPRHKVTPGVIWTSAPEPHLRGSVAADAHTNQVTFPSKHRGGLFPPRLSPDWLHSSPCYELS